jgi:hypothetical protein
MADQKNFGPSPAPDASEELTFMSTTPKLRAEELERAKQLIPFIPRLRGHQRPIRRISLAPDLAKWLDSCRNHQLRGAIRAHLSVFAIGEDIDDRDFMKRVCDKTNLPDPFGHQVWSIRPSFRPAYRLFGTFICTDWIVLFEKLSRKTLEEDTRKWEAQIGKVVRTWDFMFPNLQRHQGSRFSDYVSFKSTHKDKRWHET